MDEVSFVKKYLAFILVIGAFILISPFKVSAASEEEWSQKLDLSDSVSSTVIKLDDGIVVMKYEGGASKNSTLIKYDFKGNQLWSIKNEYGYEMGSLGDAFVVFTADSSPSITKISSNGKISWSQQYDDCSLYSVTNVIDLDSGFIISCDNVIYRYDNNGKLLKTITKNDVGNAVFGKNNYYCNFAVSLSKDKDSILVFLNDYHSVTGGASGYYPAVAKYSLDLNYKSAVIAYVDNKHDYLTKIIETENNYIITGNCTLVFNKNGQIDKVLNLSMIDIAYIDGYIYAYVCKQSDNYGVYNMYVVKYDENMNKIMEYQLPYSISNSGYNSGYNYNFLDTTSFAFIKNRGIFYKNSNDIHFVMLNSPFGNNYTSSYARPTNSNYSVLQYKLNDDNSNNTVTDDGIIDNIFENPETSSIAVVIAFVIVILFGGIGFYFGYKKKKAKNM